MTTLKRNLRILFSSPEQSSGRAIVLPPALALVLVLAFAAAVSTYVKVLCESF